jgi:hypothetical protein
MPGILVREALVRFSTGAVNRSFGASPYPKSSLAGSNLEWQAAERRTTFFARSIDERRMLQQHPA